MINILDDFTPYTEKIKLKKNIQNPRKYYVIGLMKRTIRFQIGC